MVVYLRRSGQQDQRSVYLDHRAHLDPGVHRAQDYIIEHPDSRITTDELAHVAAMSPRNFTRVFRQATGLSPKQFASKVKVQVARDLLDDPRRTIESIAGNCGFKSARQVLQPEKAKIFTAGVVLEPSQLRGFSATVDYYHIQITNDLGFLTTAVILGGCYPAITGSTGPQNLDYCNLITRSPITGGITNVNDFETNVGRVITSGVDLAVRYGLPTDVGRFGFLFDSTYLVNYNLTLGSGNTIHAAGNYDLGTGAAIGNLTPKIRFNAGLNYTLAGFNAGIRGRYIGSFDECAGGSFPSPAGTTNAGFCSAHVVDPTTGKEFPHHTVSAQMTFDLFASYLLRSPFGNTIFSAGMRNVFDTSPPLVYNSFLTYADPGYDFAGRFVYGRITHTF